MPDEPPTVDQPADSPTGPHPAGQSTDARLAGWVGDGAAPAGPPGYELLAEVGRGGMGVVYRARDVRMGREVAVKVLADRYPPGGPAARRFAAEARITGRLQHPGVPPVHEVGELAGGRPFLAMKLIRGVTLAELLAGNPERGRLVAVFESLCQAVAYAHSHGVLHRDLKPANVMVGAFGEVQVMDWGLAKVLIDGPADPDATAGGTEVTADRAESDRTQDGHALGTPAYMPPEQAVGAVADMDRRSDVFGLGAVLCHLLTGWPPYVGTDAGSTRRSAAQARLADAHERLDASGADPELVALCKRCLSAGRAERPAAAGQVADAVAGLRRAADERARRAELDAAEGRVRAAERRRRRRALRLTAALFAGPTTFLVVLFLVITNHMADSRERFDRRVSHEAVARTDERLQTAGLLLRVGRLELAAGNGPEARRHSRQAGVVLATVRPALSRLDDLPGYAERVRRLGVERDRLDRDLERAGIPDDAGLAGK